MLGISWLQQFGKNRGVINALRKAAKRNSYGGSRSLSSLDEVHYRIPPATRHPEVIDFLIKNFISDEPMQKCLGEIQDQEEMDFRRAHIKKYLEHNMSLMAVERASDRILAIIISHPLTKQEYKLSLEEKLSVLPLPQSKVRHIITLLHRLNERASLNPFDEFETDCLFDMRIGANVADLRRENVGRMLNLELLKRTMEFGRILGFKGCKTETTGLFSRKVNENCGMVAKAEYHYSEYVDDEGCKIFENMEKTHTCATLLTKRL